MSDDNLALPVDPTTHVAGTGRQSADLTAYALQHEEWSSRTFGHGFRTRGLIAHIQKELLEIEAKPYDLSEWVDVIILAIDGYWRHGGDPRDLMEHLREKQLKNFARQWPTTSSEHHPSEHIREISPVEPVNSVEATEPERGQNKMNPKPIQEQPRCAACGKPCCNCKLCVKAKGNQRDMCGKCAAKAAGK